MSDWISIKEELPTEGESVLVTIEDLNGFNDIRRTVRIGRWMLTLSQFDNKSHNWEISGENGENAYRRVVAWKPLDEPFVPKMDETETENKWNLSVDRLPDTDRTVIVVIGSSSSCNLFPVCRLAHFDKKQNKWIEEHNQSVQHEPNDPKYNILAWAEMPKGWDEKYYYYYRNIDYKIVEWAKHQSEEI